MVDPELWERTQSFYKIEKRINVFSAKILEDVYDPATMILACAGITRFLLLGRNSENISDPTTLVINTQR